MSATIDEPIQGDPTDDELDDAVAGDRTGEGATEEVTRRYERSPRDLLRLLTYAVVTVAMVAAAIAAEDAVVGFERDIVQLFDFLSPAIERVLNGVVEWIALVVSLAVFAVPLVTKRYRLFGYIFAANALSAALMALAVLIIDRNEPTVVVNVIAERAGVGTATTGSAQAIAQLTAAFVVLGPFVASRWRRAGVVVLATMVLLRFIVSFHLPANVIVAVPLGATAGVAILLAFGRPDRRPTRNAIRTALVGAGLPVTEVRPAIVDARGSTPYFATLDDGGGLFVKVLGEEERAADLMFRIYRYLRFKGVGDDRPFSSLRRTVEHEALLSLMARDVGIRTPRMRGVVKVGGDSMLLAYDRIDGQSFDNLPVDEVTDELMRRIWEQVERLRTHRIAHRDLRRANVFVDEHTQPWLIDFGFAEVAVEEAILNADVAQLLASFVVVVGPERTVDVAIDVLGRERVAEALPRLQINALSGATQAALKERKGLLKELQSTVITRCGVEDVEFEDLQRVNRRTIFTLVMLAAVTYFLIPQFADLPGIIDQVQGASWQWLPLILVFSALTYLAAAVALMGAVPQRLSIGPTTTAQVASSFASKLAPAGLGGMALNVRFLQKQGVDRTVAVSGVGLDTIAGIAGHVSLIGIFVVWAGRDAFGGLELPDPKYFVIGVLVTVGLLALGMALPITRNVVVHQLFPILRKAFVGVSDVLRRPGKVAMLLGGSIVITFSYLVAMYFSLEAFGGGLSFASAGAVFLVGAAVATAAPTPGGLGAMEAALIGGFVAAGVDNSVAVPAVFLFRLCTFWVPVLPGWLSFTWLQREDYI